MANARIEKLGIAPGLTWSLGEAHRLAGRAVRFYDTGRALIDQYVR